MLRIFFISKKEGRMSYWCHATRQLVNNEPQCLIPIKVRKVKYIYYIKPNKRSDFLQFINQSEGWEIVQEVSVRRCSAEFFSQLNPPEIVSEKELTIILPKRKKIIRIVDDDDDYKPQVD